MDSVNVFGGDSEWHDLCNAAADAWHERIERLGPSALPNPQDMADRAERIYEQRYRPEYEKQHQGRLVAIDVDTEQAFIGSTPAEAYVGGLRASLTACLFLVRVGYPTAFELKGTYRNACGRRHS
jgi:hypothetical protein